MVVSFDNAISNIDENEVDENNNSSTGNTSTSHIHNMEGDKKRYRMTPHPSKQTTMNDRSHEEDEEFMDCNDEDTMDACISQITSPQWKRPRGSDMDFSTNDNDNATTETNGTISNTIRNDQGDLMTTDSEEERKWKQWLESASPSLTPNLEAYLAAKNARIAATKQFEQALEECLEGLTRAMTEELLADSVGKIYEEQGQRFEAFESDIISTMKSNHSRRMALLSNMEQANARWERQFKKLRGDILHSTENDTDFDSMDGTTAAEGADGDPNWEELSQYDASHDNAKSFLSARGKLRDAEDALSNSLDEIHAGLKADAEAIAQVAIDFFNQLESDSLTFENDIQYHLMLNSQRRQEFEQRLQESARQTQGIIARLLSRLTGNRN